MLHRRLVRSSEHTLELWVHCFQSEFHMLMHLPIYRGYAQHLPILINAANTPTVTELCLCTLLYPCLCWRLSFVCWPETPRAHLCCTGVTSCDCMDSYRRTPQHCLPVDSAGMCLCHMAVHPAQLICSVCHNSQSDFVAKFGCSLCGKRFNPMCIHCAMSK